jgi:hypothetical protein
VSDLVQARGSAKERVMRSTLGRTVPLIIGLLAWSSVGMRAQLPPPPAVQAVSPFDITGFIQAATLNDATTVFSGGSITVNGIKITVPTNTLLQMPAFALTWQEVFAMAPAPYGLAPLAGGPPQTGLATGDTPAPPTTFEIHVQGNRVVGAGSDQYIAGLMFMAQQALNAGVGFVNFIDYTTGELRIGGTMGDPTTGARVRLNDPIGRHGRAMTHDVRFQQDEDNPTVRAETGYPMCVPREAPATINSDGTTGDTLCPEVNRPRDAAGNPKTIYTMDALPFDGSAPLGTNPLLMAPFEVGDYLTYNGNLVTDATGPYISAWGVIANVGIYTAPGTQPVYVAIDVMLLGTGGIPAALLPQEAAVRTRMEGFTTDPTSFVDLFGVDVDPCTGLNTWRYYATIGVDNVVKLGRWRWRPNTDLNFLPPTRMLLAMSENGVYFPQTPNGIVAGQYTAPNFQFIFPENLGIGNPKVPNNLQDFPFLAYGSGPYATVAPPNAVTTATSGTLDQLAPWPGGAAPLKPFCTATGAVFAPVADAGIHQSVTPNTLVTLDASVSKDTNVPPLPLTFSWQQTGGPLVALTNPLTVKPTFTSPLVPGGGAPITLEFTVTVGNGNPGLFSSARVTVTDAKKQVPVDLVTITGATYRIRRAQILVTATTSDPAAVLTLQGFGEMGPGLPLSNGVPAPLTDRLYRQVGLTSIPLTVTVTSSLGGSATLPVLVR